MGGVAHRELAAAVANAGEYPAHGMVRESPELIASEVTALQAATDRPFAVNLIPAATDTALLDAKIKQCFKLGVTAFSFFWDVRPDVVARVKSEVATNRTSCGRVGRRLNAAPLFWQQMSRLPMPITSSVWSRQTARTRY